MRNVRSGLALAAAAVATAIPLTLLSTAAGAAAKSADQDQLGTITIQSWIHAYPSDNVLSATDTDCFKISGAIADQLAGQHGPTTASSRRRRQKREVPRYRLPAKSAATQSPPGA
jgi:hypothetical protein